MWGGHSLMLIQGSDVLGQAQGIERVLLVGNEYSFRNTRHECEYRSRGATSTRVLAGPYMDPT